MIASPGTSSLSSSSISSVAEPLTTQTRTSRSSLVCSGGPAPDLHSSNVALRSSDASPQTGPPAVRVVIAPSSAAAATRSISGKSAAPRAGHALRAARRAPASSRGYRRRPRVRQRVRTGADGRAVLERAIRAPPRRRSRSGKSASSSSRKCGTLDGRKKRTNAVAAPLGSSLGQPPGAAAVPRRGRGDGRARAESEPDAASFLESSGAFALHGRPGERGERPRPFPPPDRLPIGDVARHDPRASRS